MKHLILAGLFLAAGGWVSLMGLVGTKGGGAAERDATVAGLGPYTDDGSIQAKVADLRRDRFDITITLKVADPNGKIVGGLQEEAFEVTEDGHPVRLKNFFSAGQAPLRIGLVMDYSLSMKQGKKIDGAKKAAVALLDTLRDHTDHVGLYFFNYEVARNSGGEILAMGPLDPSRRARARDLIENTPLSGGTPMLEVMGKAMKAMEKTPGRRVMAVMTDGMETSKKSTREKRIEELGDSSQKQGIPLYMISLGGGKNDVDGMTKLAEKGGGKYMHAPTGDDLKRIYAEIGEAERDAYVLEYDSPNPVEDGSTRQVAIAMKKGPVGTKTNTNYRVPGVIATGSNAPPPTGEAKADAPQKSEQSLGSVLWPLAFILGLLFMVPYAVMLLPRGNGAGAGEPTAKATPPKARAEAPTLKSLLPLPDAPPPPVEVAPTAKATPPKARAEASTKKPPLLRLDVPPPPSVSNDLGQDGPEAKIWDDAPTT